MAIPKMTIRGEKLGNTYIVVDSARLKQPVAHLTKLKGKKLREAVKRYSGRIDDIAFVVRATDILYKGGERRVYPSRKKAKRLI